MSEKTYTFGDYVTTIRKFNHTRPDMVAVGEYNNQMINVLNKLCPIKNKHLLDIGASPHGYAMESTLRLQVASYAGIGLGIGDTIEVQDHERVGKLMHMNAENLEFEPEVFDLIITLSTVKVNTYPS